MRLPAPNESLQCPENSLSTTSFVQKTVYYFPSGKVSLLMANTCSKFTKQDEAIQSFLSYSADFAHAFDQ